MAREHLIKWGTDAFEKGLSLAHIENYLLKRGLKQHEALNALHEITSFERKIHLGAEKLRKVLICILILILLVSVLFLYFYGIIKMN